MRISIYICDSSGKHQYGISIKNILETIKAYATYKISINLIVFNEYVEIDGRLYDHINIMNFREPFSKPKIFNKCIINSFVNLTKLENDLLIIIQDGITLTNDWVKCILDTSNKFDLIQYGFKDEFIVIKPNLIKEVGLFDEQLPLHYEVDYYLRSIAICRNKCSINDAANNILINPTKSVVAKLELFNSELPKNMQDELFKKFSDKWGVPPINMNDYISKVTRQTIPYCNKYYYIFEKDINQSIYNNIDGIKNLLYKKHISTIDTTISNGVYHILNYKTKTYLYAKEIGPKNINGVSVSTAPMEFYIYKNRSKYSIRLNMDLINQNNTKGWHLYTLPKNSTLFGAGNDGIWATFDIIKKDNYYLIKSYHNETNRKNNIGRYLYVENNLPLSDGDSSMEECLWLIL